MTGGKRAREDRTPGLARPPSPDAVRPGPTSNAGKVTDAKRVAVRCASVADAPGRRMAALSLPMRRLAPPVRSRPAAGITAIVAEPQPVVKYIRDPSAARGRLRGWQHFSRT